MRPVSTKLSSGATDHVIEMALRAVRAPRARSGTPPYSGPGRAKATAAAARGPPTSTSSTSTTVVRPSTVPPPAPKATAASAAAMTATLAAEAWERDTGQRQMRKRQPAERRNPSPQRVAGTSKGGDGHRDQRGEQRGRQSVCGTGEVEQAVAAGADPVAVDRQGRLLRVDLGAGPGAVDGEARPGRGAMSCRAGGAATGVTATAAARAAATTAAGAAGAPARTTATAVTAATAAASA